MHLCNYINLNVEMDLGIDIESSTGIRLDIDMGTGMNIELTSCSLCFEVTTASFVFVAYLYFLPLQH